MNIFEKIGVYVVATLIAIPAVVLAVLIAFYLTVGIFTIHFM